jgi:hypothetical protein
MSHDPSMTRTTRWVASIAGAAAIAVTAVSVAPAGAATSGHWSNSHCQLQQALFNVRHPHPSGLLLAGGNRILKQHGCAQRVPGPRHWSSTQCVDYEATFLKLHGLPSGRQLAAANQALKRHGCAGRIVPPPTQQ